MVIHKIYQPVYSHTGNVSVERVFKFVLGRKQDGDYYMVGTFALKSSGKHCPTTVTVCEHEGSLMSTQSNSSLPALCQLWTRSGRQSATAWSETLWCRQASVKMSAEKSLISCCLAAWVPLQLKISPTQTAQVVLLEINDLLNAKCVASVQIWCGKLGT